MRLFVLAAGGAALVGATSAAELVTFRNGQSLWADRVFLRGEDLVLVRGGGEVVLPPSAVVEVEPLPESPAGRLTAPSATLKDSAQLPAATPQQLVRAAAERHGLPAEFLHSVAQVESAFDPQAVSPKGALGLMQLMPATAASLGVDPRNPEQNADGGARLLRQLLLQYLPYPDQVHRALAAYHAGPGAVARYNGIPPFAETRTYIQRVLHHYRRLTQPGR